MTIRPDITEFVAELEVFSKKKLNYPSEIGEILQIVVQTGLTLEFEELIFQAKFLVRTQDVMRKIGDKGEGFGKLSTEFQSGVEKSGDLLKLLIAKTPAGNARKYTELFFAAKIESFSHLMKLHSDLSWIKNWQIDGKALPYETMPSKIIAAQKQIDLQTKGKKQNKQSIKSLYRIRKSVMLSVILFTLFILLDPPATILGWILSLWISVLLVYISIQIIFLVKGSNSH
jgi:hypothetical protein